MKQTYWPSPAQLIIPYFFFFSGNLFLLTCAIRTIEYFQKESYTFNTFLPSRCASRGFQGQNNCPKFALPYCHGDTFLRLVNPPWLFPTDFFKYCNVRSGHFSDYIRQYFLFKEPVIKCWKFCKRQSSQSG